MVNSGEQTVNWKLVSYPQESESALVVTGGNSYLGNNHKNGIGKTSFDRYVQHRNIISQITYGPQEVKSEFRKQKFRSFLLNTINKIPCGNTCKYQLRNKLSNFIPLVQYPVKKVNGKYKISNYISYPKQAKIVQRQGIYFLKLNQTYLAIFHFPNQATLIHESNKVKEKNNSRNYLENTAPLGKIAGFIIELGNKFDHQSFDDFQQKILTNSKLDLTQNDRGKLTYFDSEGNKIAINYQFSKSQAAWRVNNQKINFNYAKLYQGDNLEISDRVLRLKANDSIYEIDYRDKLPIFK